MEKSGSSRPDLVPINEVESNTVRVIIDFPDFVDKGKIGLDLSHLERLCQLAGIGRLTIRTQNENKQSRPIIVGVNKDGSATGAFEAAASSTSTESSIIPSRRPPMFRIGQWNALTISLDMEHIQNLLRQEEGGLKSPKKWAEKLNTELKNAVFQSGLKNLMQFNPSIKANYTEVMALGSIVLIALLLNFSQHEEFYPVLLGYWISYQATNITRNRMDGNPNNRISLINLLGIEVDRAVIFAIMAKVKDLVKEINPEITT